MAMSLQSGTLSCCVIIELVNVSKLILVLIIQDTTDTVATAVLAEITRKYSAVPFFHKVGQHNLSSPTWNDRGSCWMKRPSQGSWTAAPHSLNRNDWDFYEPRAFTDEQIRTVSILQFIVPPAFGQLPTSGSSGLFPCKSPPLRLPRGNKSATI